jgi:predicted GNAT family acetyltransferase
LVPSRESKIRFNLYRDVRDFYRDTYDILMRHEAQNLIPLGNIIIGNEGRDKTAWRDPANWFMATVSDETEIVITAVMTPPYNLTLYATDNIIDDEALACLVQSVGKTDFKTPGVTTEKILAESFARVYSEVTGVRYRLHKDMRIYELLEVNPDIPQIGTLRPACESDMSFLPYWIEGFNCDCFGDSPSVKPDAETYRYLMDKNLYILEDKSTPVSMAQIKRSMQTVSGVSGVYTPPFFRGKGYASSCVAGVSRLILERGFTKCVLYTDLANPVSNSIYQKIGYRPVCDSLDIKFEQ